MNCLQNWNLYSITMLSDMWKCPIRDRYKSTEQVGDLSFWDRLQNEKVSPTTLLFHSSERNACEGTC